MKKKYYGFTKQEIDVFRAELMKCLREEKNADGTPCLTEKTVRAYSSESDESLAYNMQYNTPQSLADTYVL